MSRSTVQLRTGVKMSETEASGARNLNKNGAALTPDVKYVCTNAGVLARLSGSADDDVDDDGQWWWWWR